LTAAVASAVGCGGIASADTFLTTIIGGCAIAIVAWICGVGDFADASFAGGESARRIGIPTGIRIIRFAVADATTTHVVGAVEAVIAGKCIVGYAQAVPLPAVVILRTGVAVIAGVGVINRRDTNPTDACVVGARGTVVADIGIVGGANANTVVAMVRVGAGIEVVAFQRVVDYRRWVASLTGVDGTWQLIGPQVCIVCNALAYPVIAHIIRAWIAVCAGKAVVGGVLDTFATVADIVKARLIAHAQFGVVRLAYASAVVAVITETGIGAGAGVVVVWNSGALAILAGVIRTAIAVIATNGSIG
jgi:hypothetical protein